MARKVGQRPAKKIIETSGPTTLDVAAIADLDVLMRNGGDVKGINASDLATALSGYISATPENPDLSWFRDSGLLPANEYVNESGDFPTWDYTDGGTPGVYTGAKFTGGGAGSSLKTHLFDVGAQYDKMLFVCYAKPTSPGNFGLFVSSASMASAAPSAPPDPYYAWQNNPGLGAYILYHDVGGYSFLTGWLTDWFIAHHNSFPNVIGWAFRFDGIAHTLDLYIKTGSEQWWRAYRVTDSTMVKAQTCGIRADSNFYITTPIAVFYE